ncbi:MAG: DoxX family membrane protein [Methyloprofundus sp.]|nr:DoxX family membrane protein [Methyloprofundus sp.]
MLKLFNKLQDYLEVLDRVDFLGPLVLRLYLVPVMWMAGMQKFENFDALVVWFSNSDGGLGLPFPTFVAGWATASELGGAVCLLLGFAVRWVSIPLLFTMIGAAVTVHLKNGWLMVANSTGFFASERTVAAAERLSTANVILQEHGNYAWLTEHGSLVILNNGVEFAITYAVMLVALMMWGAGRYISLDYWISQKFRRYKPAYYYD